MNIYKISQSENNRWDTYDSAVVIANNEEEARNTHPDQEDGKFGAYSFNTWASSPDKVRVEFIGVTDIEEPQVVVASFNAG